MDGGANVQACGWGTQFNGCALPAAPPDPLILTGPTTWHFDTRNAGSFVGPMPAATTFTTMPMHQPGGPDVLVLYTPAFSLELGATLEVIGDKALVIVSSSTIAITGTLDAGSRTGDGGGGDGSGGSGRAPSQGPGVDAMWCTGSFGGGGGDGGGSGGSKNGGGGGGGAFGAAGGVGGSVSGGGTGGRPGQMIALPAYLRGGCSGGRGGKSGGLGGAGGGGLELVARTSIDVAGSINAGGGGGQGGSGQSQSSGGGGGGSGGVIVFDSPVVAFAPGAAIGANGGGGAGGSSGDKDGGPGEDGSAAATSASGGSSDGNRGGSGGTATMPAGRQGEGNHDAGGGGGGGSVGYIVVHAASFTPATAIVSPSVTPR